MYSCIFTAVQVFGRGVKEGWDWEVADIACFTH